MDTLITHNDMLTWLIPLLYTICFGGLAWSFTQTLRASAESYATVYTEHTSRQFAEIFFFIPPHRILELAWSTAVCCFVIIFLVVGDFRSMAGMMRGLIVGGLVALLILQMPGRILMLLRAQRLRKFNEQLVDALMTMSNALRAGSSILQAFEHIVRQNLPPISQEFDLFLQQTRLGVKFEEALANLDKRVQSEDLTLMISAIEIARQTGGNLTEVFEKIASTIRERIRIQGRIQMLTSQGRLQGIVVGLMPLVLGFAIFVLDPAMMMRFMFSPVGMGIIATAVLLEIAGALLIKKIIAIDI